MSNSLAGASRLWQFCLVSQPKTPSFSSFHDWETSIQSMASSCSTVRAMLWFIDWKKITISHVHHRVSITELHRHHHQEISQRRIWDYRLRWNLDPMIGKIGSDHTTD